MKIFHQKSICEQPLKTVVPQGKEILSGTLQKSEKCTAKKKKKKIKFENKNGGSLPYINFNTNLKY